MRAVRVIWFVILVTLVPSTIVRAQTADAPAPTKEHPLFAKSAQYPVLPRALEIELALSAAPKHLRDAASVWVLEPAGYTQAKTGTNAFTCIVSRRAGDLFPVCWDAEGARSLLRVERTGAPDSPQLELTSERPRQHRGRFSVWRLQAGLAIG